MPIEEAIMEFVGIDIPNEEMKKGIPFVSFVVKEGEGAVFMEPLPIFMADGILKDRTVKGSEVLYRVDYLWGSSKKFAAGILMVGERTEKFLELLGHNISSGNEKADTAGLYGYLEAHLTLCVLEKFALCEISLMEREELGSPDYRAADSSYYQEVLSYVEAGRGCLNDSISGFSLPPFPKRSVFMAEWYRSRKGRR